VDKYFCWTEKRARLRNEAWAASNLKELQVLVAMVGKRTTIQLLMMMQCALKESQFKKIVLDVCVNQVGVEKKVFNR
jgi:hypothetical protein